MGGVEVGVRREGARVAAGSWKVMGSTSGRKPEERHLVTRQLGWGHPSPNPTSHLAPGGSLLQAGAQHVAEEGGGKVQDHLLVVQCGTE